MTVTKRKISVSLDEDLIDELERHEGALSVLVNEAVREDVQRRRQRRLLEEYLDRLEAEIGAPDEDLVERFMDLLR